MDETEENQSSSRESGEYDKDHDLNLKETPKTKETDNKDSEYSREESKDSLDHPDNPKDHDQEKKEELSSKNEEFLKEEKEAPLLSREESSSTKEKHHKRQLKGGVDRKNKKVKKTKVKSSIVKDSYLDTMAEESEGSVVDEEEDEDEDEEEDPLGAEIPEELKDFITDEVVEEEEEEATDVEYEPDKLDEEDLELIAENTGSKWLDDDEGDFKKLRRLKKGTKKVEPEPEQEDMWYEEEENPAFELSDVWATVAECFGQVDLVIQILKNERNANAVPMDQDSDYDPQYDPDYEKDTELAEQVEKFKLTEKQYSNEEKVLEQNLEQYVDPDELAKEYLTKEDDEIRVVDEPERLYLRYKNRKREIEERELKNEAQWMTRRLLNEFNIDLSKENLKKAYEQTFESTYKSNHTSVATDVEEKCELLLNWLLNERWEVPFILYHKRHLICPPLNDNIVWRVFQLDLEWVRLNTVSEQVQKSIDKIGHEFLPTDILYFSTNYDYLEDLNDVNVHLTYHYPNLYSKAGEKEKKRLSEDPETEVESLHEQEAEQEYMEDDIFGDFEPIENTAHRASPPSSPGNEELTKVEEAELKVKKDEKEDEVEEDRKEDFGLFEQHEVEEEKKENEYDDQEKDKEVVIETDEENDDDELDEEGADEEDEKEEEEDEEREDREEREIGMETRERKAEAKEKEDQRSLVVKKNSSLYLIETVERLGMDKVCAKYIPSANEFHKLLEKGVVSVPTTEFKVEVSAEMYDAVNEEEKGDLDKYKIEENELNGDVNVIEADMELLPGNEEYQIEEYFSGCTKGPYTTGKRVFNALTDYWAKKYSTHISVKRLLREYYREYCNITCVTTPKGEEQVEVSEPSWLVKRMAGFPIKRLTKSAQMYYNYPYHYPERRERYIYLNDRLRELKMVELYMHIIKLEKEEQIKVTIHPLTHNEQPYWKGEQYNKRFQTFYTAYKDLTNYLNSQNTNSNNYNNTNYNDQMRQMENEKTLIEKEQILLNDLHQRDMHFIDNLVHELTKVFVKRKVSRNSLWRHFYKAVIEKMVNRELVPLFRREVRELLYKSATNSVLFNCQQFLTYKVECAESKDGVMCMLNDTEGQNVYVGVVEAKGKVSYLKIYKNLMQSLNYNATGQGGPYTDKNAKNAIATWSHQIGNMIDKFEVRVILVGLVDLNSLLLYHRIQEQVLSKLQKKVKIMKAETHLPRLVASKYLMTSKGGQKNNVATNYNHEGMSNANEIGASPGLDHNYYLIMAVSVCRFHQNYLMEVTSLWSEKDENHLLRVKLHPLQELLPKERLEQGLEQVLITEVNKNGIGLDVLQETNWPKSQSYLSGLSNVMGGSTHPGLTEYINMKQNVLNYLSFVAGLGVRKAQLLLDKLRTFTPSSRSSLTQVFGPVVFLNVASFIKFEQNETTDSLDTSRIHPTESGFIAEKLCNGSLDEKLSGEEAVAEIMANPTKLDDLDLESYSVLLNDMQEMPRMYPYLLFIKNELQKPYGNNKQASKGQKSEKQQKEEKEKDMTNQEVFYSVLNLDRNGFKSGSSVNVKFEFLQHRSAKVVLMPLLLRGHVNDLQQFRNDIQKLAKDNPKYNNLTGEVFEGRVARIDYEPILEGGTYNYRVEVSLTSYQKRHMLNGFLNDLVNQRLEEFMSPLTKYDINHSNLPINTQKKKMQYKRNIRHPAYKMWPIQKVISYLKQNEVPVGESCICPMSEWDKLNLVIKTCSDPFNFATFVIYEKGQRIPGELGKELMLQNEKYNNIDQIIAQFCETLKLNLEEFYTHPKFRHNCELNKVERDLIQESALKPDNITWAIIPPNPKRQQGVNHPLRFMLVVIPPGFSVISQEAKSLQDPIYVTHKSFKLWTHEEKSLRDLIAWWKEYGYWHRNLERTKYMQEKQNNYNNF